MEVKTVLPTVIFLSFLHPANAFAPIEVTCLPMDASVVVALLRNADAAIVFVSVGKRDIVGYGDFFTG